MRSAAQMESKPHASALWAAWRSVSGVAARPEMGRKTPVFVVRLRFLEEFSDGQRRLANVTVP